jgi:hypothetical protein
LISKKHTHTSLSPGIRITQYRGREAGLQLFHLFLQKQEFTDPLVGICFYRHFNFMENWFFLLNTRVFLQLRYAHCGIAGDWVNTDLSILDKNHFREWRKVGTLFKKTALELELLVYRFCQLRKFIFRLYRAFREFWSFSLSLRILRN